MKLLPFNPFKLRNLILILAVGGGSWWFWHTEQTARTTMAWGGIPRSEYFSLSNFVRVFRNEGYMVGYSELRQNPLWVTYRLKPVANARPLPRPKEFIVDRRSIRRTAAGDYSNSGYNRGHMAPNYAITIQHGQKAQLETFYMTNISPQKPALNQKLWQRIEEVAVDRLAPKFGELWVITGPVFEGEREFMPSGVEIPDAFYKIIIAPDGHGAGQPAALSFLVPQWVSGTEPLSDYATTIDAIEFFTGLDFLPEMPDIAEEELEATPPGQEWDMPRWSRLPPRY